MKFIECCHNRRWMTRCEFTLLEILSYYGWLGKLELVARQSAVNLRLKLTLVMECDCENNIHDKQLLYSSYE